MAFELPALPYAFDALEPHMDARTMEIHHDRHHAGYVAKLNAAIEKAPELAGKSLDELLGAIDSVPDSLRAAVRNNGGGHVNHSMFWTVMSPTGGGAPSGTLGAAIDAAFGSYEAFKKQFSAAAATRFGSGWAWLVLDGGQLRVTSSANQDSPIMAGQTPIMGLDVWEHAYYLNYQNRRGDYVSAFYEVINWDQVAANYTAATT